MSSRTKPPHYGGRKPTQDLPREPDGDQIEIRPTGSFEESDLTKRRAYVIADLAAKLLSSIALVALGIAGWLLQARAQETQEDARKVQHAATAFELEERRYLPMLRTLTELEVVLREAADSLRIPQNYTGQNFTAPKVDTQRYLSAAKAAGIELRTSGYSLFLPISDRNITIAVPYRNAVDYAAAEAPRINTELRAAVLLYAELLRGSVFIDMMPANARCSINAKDLRLICRGKNHEDVETIWRWGIDPESVPAWQAWFSGREVEVSYLKEYSHVPFYLDELRIAVAKVIHETLSQHVDLGDRYVSIRSDVMRAAAERQRNANR